MTSGSLVFLYLASWSERWALIYLALSQFSSDYTCDQSQVVGGQREERLVGLGCILWGLERRGPCAYGVGGPCSPLVTVTPAGRPQGRSAKKQKEAQGGSPRSLWMSGVPFRVAQARKRGSQPASISPCGPTQVSGRPERPGRRYWFCGILQSDLLPQFPYYCILPESSKSTPLHSIQAL